MRPALFILLFTIQKGVFGIFFQPRFVSRRTSAFRETSLAEVGSRIEDLRRLVRMGNVSQELKNSNQPLGLSSQDSFEISDPAVNLAHRSSSTHAKQFWNQFMFRGKSDLGFVLPIRKIEVREQKCRALSFSQRIFSENCETLEVPNNVCFGKCEPSPSSGRDGGVHCAVCSPHTITDKTVTLQCDDNTEITKVVQIIEDCQCKTKQGQRSLHNGPVLMDPSVHQ